MVWKNACTDRHFLVHIQLSLKTSSFLTRKLSISCIPNINSVSLTSARKCRLTQGGLMSSYIGGVRRLSCAWHQDIFLMFWRQFFKPFSAKHFDINGMDRSHSEHFFLATDLDILALNYLSLNAIVKVNVCKKESIMVVNDFQPTPKNQ